MRAAADDPYITATDLADQLVKQGIPFRQAHAQVGQLVRHCLENNMALTDLEASVKARVSTGGTAPQQVKAALEKALEELDS